MLSFFYYLCLHYGILYVLGIRFCICEIYDMFSNFRYDPSDFVENIHDVDPIFDRKRLLYAYPNGFEERLVLNQHL